MDFTVVLQKALPWIGAAATGNVPALVAMAAQEVSEVLGVKVKAEPDAIANAVAGATPDQIAQMRARDQDFALKMKALGFEDAKDMRAAELATDQAYLGDVQNARQQHSNDKRVFWLGIAVLLTFLLDMVATFAFVVAMSSGGIKISDVGIVAAVFGLLGTLNGYVAANAQQVISYYFGSSRGSNDKTVAMSRAITQLGDAASAATAPPR